MTYGEPTLDEQVENLFPVDGPHSAERSREAARSIAALVRYLNHATYHAEATPYPATIDAVVRSTWWRLSGTASPPRWLAGCQGMPYLLGSRLRRARMPPMAERWRTGRKIGRTIYRQGGPEASDEDVLIGVMDTPDLAALVVDAVNASGPLICAQVAEQVAEQIAEQIAEDSG